MRRRLPAVRSYAIAGQISGIKAASAYGWHEMATVELVPAYSDENSKPLEADIRAPDRRYKESAGPDGRFYFDDIPDGEYLLGVNLFRAPSAGSPFMPTYYPGTSDRRKAARLRVGKGKGPVSVSFDIVSSRVAVASVPIVVTFADGTRAPKWFVIMELAWPNEAAGLVLIRVAIRTYLLEWRGDVIGSAFGEG